MKNLGLLLSLLIISTSSFAECNFNKAARNKMLDQKVGISGSCDAQKATKNKATKKLDDSLGIDSKKIKNETTEKKENIENKVSTVNKVVDHIK
ncbi:hypothetical protein [Providencia sneebia]|uniref:Lipoprotein n=1 Tax=Providencia sneebia DSM 19967 TaxID=1141660 RepID=K8WMH6_9GAMM|nr:hypothetical protein [Providencia sneebia]EKT57350.1 hypothetical protein OO7_08175 [Providencia sneebia DSM 19967]